MAPNPGRGRGCLRHDRRARLTAGRQPSAGSPPGRFARGGVTLVGVAGQRQCRAGADAGGDPGDGAGAAGSATTALSDTPQGRSGCIKASTYLLLQALRSGEMAAQFDELLRYNQMDPTDLADALTAYTVVMWLIVNDQLDGQSDPARLKAVSEQIGPQFRASPELRSLSPEQRAAEYERVAAMSLYGIAAYTAFEQEGDRSAKAELQAAAQESMQRVGWDLAALDITHRGFEPRR